ncbi:uncharacterized protein LOC142231279 [Haematobia irritans]|uniref:uncharacterized protein LOC142231279 n=1 Tax=Haematobia irritans TaxID=7368 RepID=UPI003F4F5045
MAEDLASLVAYRGRLKGSLTRMLSASEEPVEKWTYELTISRLERLEEVWKEFERTTDEMYKFRRENDYTDPSTDFITYEDKFIASRGNLYTLKQKLAPNAPTSNTDAISKLAEQQAEFLEKFGTSSSSKSSELPRINIPQFSGSYKDWPSFKDLFESTVNSKTTLTNTEKFHYLKSLLKDDAAKIIQHIPITESAFQTVWIRLNDRYDRPKHIVNSFIEAFMSLPATITENPTLLRKLSDGANEIIRGLDAIGHDERDCWVIYLLLGRVDSETKSRWIQASRDNTKPTVEDFLDFLDCRTEELELCQRKFVQQSKNSHSSKAAVNSNKCLVSNENKQNLTCLHCKAPDHNLFKCPTFLQLSAQERRSLAKNMSLCYNCLRSGHSVSNCLSKTRCRSCRRRHHTYLHLDSVAPSSDSATDTTAMNVASTSAASGSSNNSTPWSTVANVANPRDLPILTSANNKKTCEFIMPTALVNVRNRFGKMVKCRALLDSASKLSYITESCIQRLGLSRSLSKILVSGIGSVNATTTRGLCQIYVTSNDLQNALDAVVHIIPNITSPLPNTSFSQESQNLIHDLSLADPNYNISSPIDILFGVEHFWNIFTYDRRYDSQGNTIAVSTIFGWVVTCVGNLTHTQKTTTLVSNIDIDKCLSKFWEVEEPDRKINLDPDAHYVEEHFKTTHTRDCKGKYSVQLPFKVPSPTFGNTVHGALCRFYAVERRLLRNPALREQYIDFMREYDRLGHMQQIPANKVIVADGKLFYLPHHPVLGEKIRVVFDGSFQDSNGISLNNTLHIGPSIQRDLFSVCIRFRFKRYVFSADIVKMFRQILVNQEHRDYQRIVWRENPNEVLKHYHLCTVTYGTACAPYLAVRVLEQLAHDYKSIYPKAAKILLADFYVDDVLTGGDTEDEVMEIRNELVKLLKEAGLELRKWKSNCKNISVSDDDNLFLRSPNDDVKKVVGIFWKPSNDILGYKINLVENAVPTKRQVLSDVARIFDPMGLLSPIIVKFKIMLRELWTKNLSWDESLPKELAHKWMTWRTDLKLIENFAIDRFIYNTHHSPLELHGFSDASVQAYSAVIYARCVENLDSPQVKIIAAKTRVAPIKQRTLPQLELCGALLLARLLKRVKEAVCAEKITVRLWCDSTIVLSWLSQPPIKLKTFEGNRTSEILETAPRRLWNHVSSMENPADCASRGVVAANLLNFSLWWNGPEWLRDPIMYNNALTNFNKFDIFADPEALNALKTNAKTMVTTIDNVNFLDELIVRVSKWSKLVRILAYIYRFFYVTKRSILFQSASLTFDEIHQAKLILLKHAQKAFEDDLNQLKHNRAIRTHSNILKLTPFVDQNGLLRVGGRLRNSELAVGTQNPIILPKTSRITLLILQDLHEKYLHPGVSSLFVIARQMYWILGARNIIRSLTHKCIKCFRQRQKMIQQQMGDLPSVRVRQAFPFENTGCDYAGPFILKQHSGRKAQKTKGYICLFVCLVTTAIHLELATDLSTECFLAALRRFISRRGKCRNIYSDNGRNFLGASKELNEMHKVLISQNRNEAISLSLADDGIKWHFIPPFTPHYGGIWESAVRSVKLHMKRVIQNTELTYEQMHTLLAQIEGVVNSRLLGSAPDTECGYLSPAHFLIGRPCTVVPEGNISDINPNRLSYWQHVQNMFQGFWKKWHNEYLTSLQQRPKWNRKQPNLANGDIVLVKDKNLPPSKWLMAKIIETYPGHDEMVRTVKLRTQNGEMTRHITNLAKLPTF